MLILTRHTKESIMIGDKIEVKVINIERKKHRDKVYLGFQAPENVRILRKELLDTKGLKKMLDFQDLMQSIYAPDIENLDKNTILFKCQEVGGDHEIEMNMTNKQKIMLTNNLQLIIKCLLSE